jgi:hypothetical protein
MMFRYVCIGLLVISGTACSGASTTSPTASAPTVSASTPASNLATFHVTGVVSEDDGRPVTGAKVTILNRPASGTTDASGVYRIDFETTRPTNAAGLVGWVRADSAGHDPSYNALFPTAGSQDVSQNIHVYRITQITAGQSILLTVAPGDTSCGDSDEFVCRAVHIVAPTDGLMTLEGVPTPSAANAGLEILGPAYQCCSLTASSVRVVAGTEVVANVGMWWTSSVSQSFTLKTSLVQP